MFGIIKLIKSLLTLVANIIAWLLLQFHLWVPAAFCVGFIIFCALGGRNPVEYSNVFFAGLGISLVISLIFMLLTARFKLGDKGKRGSKNEPPPRRFILEEQVTLERTPAAPPVAPTAPPPVTQSLGKYLDIPDEEPMIFASRKDPSLFICEYSSRVEVYQKRGERVKLIEVIDR